MTRKSRFKFIVSVSILFTLFSCVEEPTFSSVPQLEFVDAQYVINNGAGSFNITFRFQDEEGNIFPDRFVENVVVTMIDGDTRAYFRKDDSVFSVANIPMSNATGVDLIDVVPTIDFFDNCEENFGTFGFSVEGLEGDQSFLTRTDTLAENLKIRVFKKRNGQDSLLSFGRSRNGNCELFDLLDSKINEIEDPDFTGAKEGEITYIYKDDSRAFINVIRSDSFKLQLWLYDADLQRSNIISSPDMILSQEALNFAGQQQ